MNGAPLGDSADREPGTVAVARTGGLDQGYLHHRQAHPADDADAVSLTDPAPPGVAGGGVDLAEVVLDAVRDGDQRRPGREAPAAPEPWGGCPLGRNTKLPAASVEGVSHEMHDSPVPKPPHGDAR